jgi:hypothetical protein
MLGTIEAVAALVCVCGWAVDPSGSGLQSGQLLELLAAAVLLLGELEMTTPQWRVCV